MNINRIIFFSIWIALLAESLLIYLIYFLPIRFPPLYRPDLQIWVNAILNFASAISVFIAYLLIKRKKKLWHKLFIHLGLFFSGLFLINYIFYHFSVGHSTFTNETYRPLYLFILISHLLCSIISLPLIFISYGLAIFGHLSTHKKLARVSFLCWEYVSLTGILIVFMVKFLNKA